MSEPFWWDQAACRLTDAELFNPAGANAADNTLTRARLMAAIRICHGCPVTETCLRLALKAKDDGVRGGQLLIDGIPRRLPGAPATTFASRKKAA